MDRAGLKDARIQRYGASGNNEVLISLDLKETREQALDQGKNSIVQRPADANRARQAGPEQRRL